MLTTGRKGHLETIVTEETSARSVGSGGLLVYATPSMIGLVEETCWRSVADELGEGQSTVGTKIRIDHLAATPVGMKVWCDTELIEVDRRRLEFAVRAYDEAGLIAEGTHERFIINVEKFMAKAMAKKQ
ncbi:MAG: thioesterase family protein [Oscillospiraceae bacterium]|nr:thioesterase family protein [Oscillospiraceae bacterium]